MLGIIHQGDHLGLTQPQLPSIPQEGFSYKFSTIEVIYFFLGEDSFCVFQGIDLFHLRCQILSVGFSAIFLHYPLNIHRIFSDNSYFSLLSFFLDQTNQTFNQFYRFFQSNKKFLISWIFCSVSSFSILLISDLIFINPFFLFALV